MSLTCKSCEDTNLEGTINGMCADCHRTATEKWQAKMAIRQDPAQFDMVKLVNRLLSQHWMHECEIIPRYMPPNPGDDTRPTCQVRYTYEDGTMAFLRYSKGPMQGYFWDMYGEDMGSPERALICISQSPAPPRVGVVIPTHGE
jgi:hypothetical protein|nr:hypothetical protein [Neorhizobium tomejilense]